MPLSKNTNNPFSAPTESSNVTGAIYQFNKPTKSMIAQWEGAQMQHNAPEDVVFRSLHSAAPSLRKFPIDFQNIIGSYAYNSNPLKAGKLIEPYLKELYNTQDPEVYINTAHKLLNTMHWGADNKYRGLATRRLQERNITQESLLNYGNKIKHFNLEGPLFNITPAEGNNYGIITPSQQTQKFLLRKNISFPIPSIDNML